MWPRLDVVVEAAVLVSVLCEERDGLGGFEVFELHNKIGCEWGRREWEGMNGRVCWAGVNERDCLLGLEVFELHNNVGCEWVNRLGVDGRV